MRSITVTFKDPDTKAAIDNVDVTWALTKTEDPNADPPIASNTTTTANGVLTSPSFDETRLTKRGPRPGSLPEYPQVWLHWTIPGYQSGKVNILLIKNPLTTIMQVLKKVASPAATPAPSAAPVEIKNDARDWLTYESLFNKVEFRKPNCRFDLSLYLIPINQVTIWLSEDISDSDLQTFTEAFFPDFDPKDIKRIASAFWPWRTENDAMITEQYGPSFFMCTPRKEATDREKAILYVEPYAVLPFNRFDNTVSSFACGTKNHDGMGLLKVKGKTWKAWKTASRSCIMQLPAGLTKPKDVPWIPVTGSTVTEPWSPWEHVDLHRKEGFESLQNEPFSLRSHGERAYSIKTGVEWIGRNYQGGANHKDVIGDWLIGCLRSDYISQIRRELNPPRDGVTILTELITITEKKTRSHTDAGGMPYKEGIQVRKISDLKPDKYYLAPLNVPFVGLDLKKFYPEYHFFNDTAPSGVTVATTEERKEWSNFWKIAFAHQLGTAKALLTLRYGLQILNPNQQNFLIEFEDDGEKVRPTGMIAVRDLADASIHREAAWALFEFPGLPPQDAGGKQGLANPKVPTLEFEFTPNRMKEFGFDNQDDQETGTTAKKFGPPGTQFLWQRFSAYVNLDKGSDVQNHPVLSDRFNKNTATTVYKNLLIAMADWGMAHNKAYIATVESHLGKNFRGIDWSRCPNPSRLERIATIGDAKTETRPTVGVFTPASTNDHQVRHITFGVLSDEERLLLKPLLPSGTNADLLPDGTTKDDLLAEKWMRINGSGFQAGVKIEIAGVVIDDPTYLIRAAVDRLYVRDRMELRRFGMNDFAVKISNRHQPGPPKKSGEPGSSILVEPSTYKYVLDTTYVEEIDWEEMSAKVIHDYLASADGQAAIRKLKKGWRLVTPSVVIKFSENGEPFAWKRIFMRIKNGGAHWTDLTDKDGKLHLYEADRDAIQLFPQLVETDFAIAEWLECKSGTFGRLAIEVM